MGIIPLEKLIEYKGNRYELSRAMIELAKTGSTLLKAETKYRQGKYIPTVMKNILDGNIKYEYEDGNMEVDEDAPFKRTDNVHNEYNAMEYVTEDDVEEAEDSNYEDIADDFDEDISDDYEFDDYEDDEEEVKKS